MAKTRYEENNAGTIHWSIAPPKVSGRGGFGIRLRGEIRLSQDADRRADKYRHHLLRSTAGGEL